MNAELPLWLDDPSQSLPRSFGGLVVEWALSNLRHWPDLAKQKAFRSPHLLTSCEALAETCRPVLERTKSGSELWKWLGEEMHTLSGYQTKQVRPPT